MMVRTVMVLMLVFTLAACFTNDAEDKVILVNHASVNPAAVMVDGRRGECVEDDLAHGSQQVDLDNLQSPEDCISEVAVFTDSHGMQMLSPVTTWTDDGGDELSVTMTPLTNVPIAVWIMYQNASGTRSEEVNDEVNLATQLFDLGQCGVEFHAEVTDVSTAPFDVTLIDAGCSRAAEFKQVASKNGTINVYYIRSVQGGLQGERCPDGLSDVVLIGAAGNIPEALAHELGHTFSLRHWDESQPPIGDNLMMSIGTDLKSLSLGQCFRSNLNNGSVLKRSGIVPGPGRSCHDTDKSKDCPTLAIQ